MRIVFMGTPDFAVVSLEALMQEHEIVGVVTKIDKPNQRGKKIQFTPVKQYALEHNLPISQPNSVKDIEFLEKVKQWNPELIVVVAYGKILPKEVLDFPKYGVINVHSSLLPKYRGAAPIHAALIHGEEETGVSIMYVVEALDAGPVLAQAKTKIQEQDNCESLHDRLKNLGAELLRETVVAIEENRIVPREQEETRVSFVRPFQKEDCHIDWKKSSREIFNFVRGMDPFPGAFCYYGEKLLKIARVEEYSYKKQEKKSGEILENIKGKGILVATGDGAVIITKAKPENKKMLSGVDLINGNFLEKGEYLR